MLKNSVVEILHQAPERNNSGDMEEILKIKLDTKILQKFPLNRGFPLSVLFANQAFTALHIPWRLEVFEVFVSIPGRKDSGKVCCLS